MSTAEEGGATANATTSSYGGGGAGGKFRKKPFRRQTTPYDRPPTALRVNNTNNNGSSNWLTKMVVEPASKLISYGADRFFPSVFRRRLPLPRPPPPPQPPERHVKESAADQGADLNSQGGEQEPKSGHCSQQVNSSSSNDVAELEHLLKQKTFTRSEIAHLTELLQSQAADVSPRDASRKNVVSVLDSGRKKELESCVPQGNRNDGIGSSVVPFTPIHNSKVLENDIASPAELAKAYMGSRPSQVSPSVLGMRNQLGTGLLSNTLIASKSPSRTLTKKPYLRLGAAENGFMTPRSRDRSAIYSTTSTLYSRAHPTSTVKGSGINRSGFAGPSTSLSPLSPMENDENFNSPSLTLKRRSSALDDEVGSVGLIRRTRQKANLLAPRFHHTASGVGTGSLAKHKPQLNVEERNKVSKNSEGNHNESVPVTSYAHVPSKSREVAAKILQQLEKFSPKEKSSESKIAAVKEKSPSRFISSSHPRQPLRSLEGMGYSKLPLNVSDDIHDSSPRKQGEAVENSLNASIVPSGSWNPALNNNSSVSLKSSTSILKIEESQPQNQNAFRMRAEEGSLEQEDVEFDGPASRSLSGNTGPFLSAPDTKPAEELKTTIQSENKSYLGLISRSTSEHSSGAITCGQEMNVIDVPASESNRATSQSQVFASSVPVFDRPNEANSTNLFSFSSKAADKFPSFPSESLRRAESEPESSSSLATSIGSEIKTPESGEELHFKLIKAVDTNGKCDDVSSLASKGPFVSSCSGVSAFSDMNRAHTGSAPLFTTSTSTTNFAPTSTSAPFSGSFSGFGVNFSSVVEPVSKSGSSVDLSNAVSTAPTVSFSTSSCSTFAEVAATSSGTGILKLDSSFSHPTRNNLQGSLFASPASEVVTLSQGTTMASVSPASFPALNMNTSSTLGLSPTPSFSFGFSSTPSSDTTSLASADGPTPSTSFKFGATPTSGSEGSAVTPVFSFGSASVSFSSTNTIGSSSIPATPVFSFGGASVPSSAINTAGGASGIFGFGGYSQSTGFSFSASTPAAPMASNSSIGASPPPIFSFTSASGSAPSLPPMFSNPPPVGSSFAASFNNDQMNAEDSMAEDTVPSTPTAPSFGQPSVSPSPATFPFAPSQTNQPFVFGGQQSQAPPPQNLGFQASGSLGFSLGSGGGGGGGGDKSGRKIVRVSRSKNRKK